MHEQRPADLSGSQGNQGLRQRQTVSAERKTSLGRSTLARWPQASSAFTDAVITPLPTYPPTQVRAGSQAGLVREDSPSGWVEVPKPREGSPGGVCVWAL